MKKNILVVPLYKYGFSVVAVVLATLLKVFIANNIGPLPPFILYFGAIMIVTIYQGLGPGMLAVALSTFAGWFFFLPPYMSLNFYPRDLAQLVVFFIESTVTVKITDDLRRVKNVVSISERRFRSILENSKEGITLRTRDGKLLYMSPATEKLIGYSLDEYTYVSPPDLVCPEDKEKYIALMAEVIKKPFISVTITYRCKTKRKGLIWIEDTITNLLEDPNVGAIVSNFRNVSERMELEDRRNNFINMASHELKTPLTSINVFVEVLRKRINASADQQSGLYIEKIRGQIANMTGLVQELLDVTRMQKGSLKIEKQKFLLMDLAKEIIDDLQSTTQHPLELDWQTRLPIYADKERIRQVLTNLITNAIKYSPDDKKIIVSSCKKGKDLVVSVRDFGIGIPKHEQKKIFERFYQVKNHSTYPGLGLGLFISSQILQQHGGKIWVESNQGKGSTFSFSLPIASSR